MTVAEAQTIDLADAHRDNQSILDRSGQELILYRLRCAQTANGLSHYYMYGDLDPSETIL